MENSKKYCSVFNSDFSETVAYNNPLFPAYVAYGILSSYPDYSGISHWHSELEFIVVKKGAMTYNVNGEFIKLPKGSGIMVNSRQLHYGFSPEHNECEFLCMVLSTELLQGNRWFYQNCIEPVTENASCPYLYLGGEEWTAAIMELLDGIYFAFEKTPIKPPAYFELIGKFTAIMKLLYENQAMENRIQRPESSDISSLRSMVSYIEKHYMERISLEKIASSGACCKSKCSLLFKKYLRDTPITYTTKLRLRKSLSMLLGTERSIADIAYENGFGGASYYCEVFKKYYGISPLLYKQSQENLFSESAPAIEGL